MTAAILLRRTPLLFGALVAAFGFASAGCSASGEAQGPEFTAAGWNLESGDSDPQVLATYLASAPEAAAVSLWGLSEVDSRWASALEAALSRRGDFQLVLGSTGRSDRLAIAVDSAQFLVLATGEVHSINTTGYARSPLWAHLRHRSSGHEFLFLVNHLYRSRDAERHRQAELLNRWGAAQELPIVAVGDYNLDWNARAGEGAHDLGYDLLTADDVFRWLRPARLLRTQCGSRHRDVLDFVFVAGVLPWAGRSWIGSSHPAYCPGDRDNLSSSDHRPVFARFTVR